MITKDGMDTRDPVDVVNNAADGWVNWQPGDGTSYMVRLLHITHGPDRGDAVLLINCVGAVAGFVVRLAEYRKKQSGPWTKALANKHGNGWVWDASRPLLSALDVT